MTVNVKSRRLLDNLMKLELVCNHFINDAGNILIFNLGHELLRHYRLLPTLFMSLFVVFVALNAGSPSRLRQA